MCIIPSNAAVSPDFRKVELGLAPAERNPAQQSPSADSALSSKITLANHPQATATEFKASIYTKSASGTSSSAWNLSAIGANASSMNSNLDVEEATTDTIEALAETSDAGLDDPATDNSVDLSDPQNGDLTDGDDLSDDSNADRRHSKSRHLDLLEARCRAKFVVMDRLVSQLIAARLVVERFAALPLPE